MLLSCEELTTAAMIRPNERKAIAARQTKMSSESDAGDGHPVKLMREKDDQDRHSGHRAPRPVIIDATSSGTGVIGVTL